MAQTLTLKRPTGRRKPAFMQETAADEEDLAQTNLSNIRINRELTKLCRLAHDREPGKETRNNAFGILHLADDLLGKRVDENPKLGKYLHVRRLLIDRWWQDDVVRTEINRADGVLLAAQKERPQQC